MIGKSFLFNGQSISRTTADYQIGLDVVQWKSLDVSDEQTNIQGFHGVKLSPTFARSRRITIEGIILADTKAGSSKAMDFLENLFALQGIPDTVELLPFIVTDEQDRQREIQVKIKEPVEIEITDNDRQVGENRRFRVVLQSEDPRYYNSIEQSVAGVEGVYGGVKLGVTLGTKLNDYFNSVDIYNAGNIETPLEITITAKGNINTPLLIKNISNNTFFGLDINAVANDVIIVNSKSLTATKNGVNIKANRIEGSTRPKAIGNTSFSILDNDGGLYESDFDITIKFRDTLI